MRSEEAKEEHLNEAATPESFDELSGYEKAFFCTKDFLF